MRLPGCFGGGVEGEVGYGFKTVRRLGKGAGGNVWLAREEGHGRAAFAVKSCDVAGPVWAVDMARKECQALTSVGWGHPNLVRPLEVRLTPDSVQLFLQHYSGGTLEAYCKRRRVDEDLACYLFHQLVSVIEHLHSNQIAYRDLKLSNVLLSRRPTRGSPPRLVLCDLGTAKAWTGSLATCETFVGTPGFMAPQVLASMFNCSSAAQGATGSTHERGGGGADDDSDEERSHRSSASRSSHHYDARKADMWALGALLHYLLHQQLPYGYDSFGPLLPPAEGLLTLYEMERQHTWQDAAGTRALRGISPEAQDLLGQLLHPDEQQRISIRRVKQHPWFNRPLPKRYASALEELRRECGELAAAPSHSAYERCRELAGEAVGVLFELARSPAGLARLRTEHRCLRVPLSPCSLRGAAACRGASCTCGMPDDAMAGELQAVVRRLEAEAVAADLRLPPGLADSASSQASPFAAAAGAVLAPPASKAAAAACRPGRVRGDDTCYLQGVGGSPM